MGSMPIDALAGIGGRERSRIVPKVPLPMVNWIPLRKITNTIFEEINDEQTLQELDFAAFEEVFKAKKTKDIALKLAGMTKKEMVSVVESNRARNLVITYRRIGMDYDFLKTTVENSDLTELLPEHAELLLGYIPTDDEKAALDKHAHEKDRLDEAERFMWEMLNVERYESRLRVMAYIGFFDEILYAAQPQVDCILRASRALKNSAPFKKVLEIILAFGNYMNSAKRGIAYGFKLESFARLLDTRSSSNRNITLLHWIAQTITDKYPQCEHFYETLEGLEEASRVSIVTLGTDVAGLRKGIDLILYEREKQQTNYILYTFYINAVEKVAKLTDEFKQMKEAYEHIVTQFNESPQSTEPFEFFGIFSKFVKEFKKCLKDNKRRKEAPQKKTMLKVLTRDEFAQKFRSA